MKFKLRLTVMEIRELDTEWYPGAKTLGDCVRMEAESDASLDETFSPDAQFHVELVGAKEEQKIPVTECAGATS